MADIIKDSFAESNLHTKVIFQRGRDVTDWELNEAQDVVRVPGYRATKAGLQADTQNPGANDGSWEVVENTGDTSNKVFINGRSTIAPLRSGYLLVDGVPLFMDAGGEVVTGFTTYGGIGTRVDKLWLRVEELEVADPAASAQLGETTRRKKLTYSWVIQEGGAAAPTGTDPITHPIWVSGGVQYFLMATITRTSGVAAIVNADIVDNRFLLAPYAVAQITRQSNFTVNAVVANRIETSDGLGVVPTSDTLELVVDTNDDFAGMKSIKFTHGGAGISTPVEMRMNGAGVFSDLDGAVALADNHGLVCEGTELKLGDSNTLGESASGALPLTSTGAGALFTWPQVVSGASDPSIVGSINAKPYVTVGAGGNFSTIAAAVAYYNANVEPSQGCHLVLRDGVHIIDSYVNVIAQTTIESEGGDPNRCVVEFTGTLGTPAKLASSLPTGGLCLRHLTLLNTSYGSIASVGRAFKAYNCLFRSTHTPTRSWRVTRNGMRTGGEHFITLIGLNELDLAGGLGVSYDETGMQCEIHGCTLDNGSCGAAIAIHGGTGVSYSFRDTTIVGGIEGGIIFKSCLSYDRIIDSVHIDNCRFYLKPASLDGSYTLASNVGFFYPEIMHTEDTEGGPAFVIADQQNMHVESVVVRDTLISTDGTEVDDEQFPMLMHWRGSGYTDGARQTFTVGRAIFDNVTFTCSNVSYTPAAFRVWSAIALCPDSAELELDITTTWCDTLEFRGCKFDMPACKGPVVPYPIRDIPYAAESHMAVVGVDKVVMIGCDYNFYHDTAMSGIMFEYCRNVSIINSKVLTPTPADVAAVRAPDGSVLKIANPIPATANNVSECRLVGSTFGSRSATLDFGVHIVEGVDPYGNGNYFTHLHVESCNVVLRETTDLMFLDLISGETAHKLVRLVSTNCAQAFGTSTGTVKVRLLGSPAVPLQLEVAGLDVTGGNLVVSASDKAYVTLNSCRIDNKNYNNSAVSGTTAITVSADELYGNYSAVTTAGWFTGAAITGSTVNTGSISACSFVTAAFGPADFTPRTGAVMASIAGIYTSWAGATVAGAPMLFNYGILQ